MHDSGKRRTTETGAQSDPSHANAAMELLSPYSLWQLSTWLGKGAEKYAPRNWEQGIPFSICIGKLQRHLAEYQMGKTDEPHLDAIGFWWHALTHYEAMIKLGKLPASLNDLPMYEKQRDDTEPEEVGEFTIKKVQDTRKSWYIILTSTVRTINPEFLHKDLEIYSSTGWTGGEEYGDAPGYYINKEHAKMYIDMYQSKPFVCPAGWVIKWISDAGWCINNPTSRHNYFLWKTFIMHQDTTGWLEFIKEYRRDAKFGEAPGYWPTKEAAEAALVAYLEKTK